MDKTLYIPIDTTIRNTVECPKLVKRGDTLLLQIKVFNNGALADLTGQSVDIILKKSDGTRIERTIDTSSISNGVVSVKPGQQSTLVQGKVSGELQVYTNGSLSSSNTFSFNVDESLADDVLEVSKDDIQVLADLRNLIASGQIVINDYKNNILAIGNSVAAIEALANIKSYIDTNLPALQSENAKSIVNKNNLKTENDKAPGLTSSLKSENDKAPGLTNNLKTQNDNAATNFNNLVAKNTESINTKNDLDSSISVAQGLKNDLLNQNSSVNQHIINNNIHLTSEEKRNVGLIPEIIHLIDVLSVGVPITDETGTNITTDTGATWNM